MAKVHSIPNTTQSYTIMPTISATARLLSPLFIVLQETNGVVGPIVQKNLFRADNIHVMASKSGKMQAAHLRAWFTDVFFPYVQNDVALMVDSWSTYKPSGLIESVTPPGRALVVVTVPPGPTSLCQPLDVFGIRMMKEFQKTVYDRVIQAGLMDELNGRNFLLKTLSLTINQMCSPRFADMSTVGWNHPGYFEDTPEFHEFKTPNEYCFQSEAAKKKEKCHTAECANLHLHHLCVVPSDFLFPPLLRRVLFQYVH